MGRGPLAIGCGALVAGLACATSEQKLATLGTPGCDARLELWGWVMDDRRDHALLEIVNTSTSAECMMTHVTLVAIGAIDEDLIHIATPSGWTATRLRCDTGADVCGVEWRHEEGVPPSQSQKGFGLLAPAQQTPRLKSLIVQVGKKRIALPAEHYGTAR